ncbi:hypothetical protein CH298_23040 [Rhodococcoides fascians]|uniref:hypothetical protein n=1 Tax=Rhodococcoides fascians TaxID=1828 RepID=UPI000B9AE8EB|nr:hypothetical protein [Rhodococcus fascians]OZE85526.1 hypothetical protein CH303_23395 [Rhodococcus fascians]OZF12033.1 hypothetical protein CH298_23040 [Rhodococcus fascians]OZF14801.1 hypothetical protein CH297_23420 [Rhodococcus fascians]OZF61380.1 hypothetical protein CH308_23040 [Rhodococcus fascians]OZF64485.1 hypothetical protein CH307_23235 [Rhodococcus fascians]
MTAEPMRYTAADLPPRLTKPDGSPDVRGLLAFTETLPDELQNAEDCTAENDLYARPRSRRRPATATERTLLRLLGFTLPDEVPGFVGVPLKTHVTYAGSTVRIRTWPSLKDQIPTAGVQTA